VYLKRKCNNNKIQMLGQKAKKSQGWAEKAVAVPEEWLKH
jgi:hypothetical protein